MQCASTHGNAAAKHRKGVEAENLIREAKKADRGYTESAGEGDSLYSGGTESNNTALIGTALAKPQSRKNTLSRPVWNIRRSTIRCHFLEEMGFEVTYLPVDHLGHISLEDLEKSYPRGRSQCL